MPYIDKEKRAIINAGNSPTDPGELNYAITVLVDKYLVAKGGPRYVYLNEIIGAMECAKLELYRRIIGPYEDKKIKIAGDVYSSREYLK